MEVQIKNLRLRIDGLAQLVKELEGSAELTKSHNALIIGKAWLGKCLGALGTPSPYPKDGERHSVADIEKTADTLENTMGLTGPNWGNNHIEKVDWLRQQISKVLNQGAEEIEHSPSRESFLELPLMWYYFEAKKELMIARFWLGFELERIKKDA